MLHALFNNMEATAAVILFGIGFTILLLHRNLIKKIMGMNIMDTAVYLFLAAKGYIEGRGVPIVVDGVQEVSAYIIGDKVFRFGFSPVPSGLVLTGIVVSVSTTALMLALTKRLYETYGSLDLDEILILAKEGERQRVLYRIFPFSPLFWPCFPALCLPYYPESRREI